MNIVDKMDMVIKVENAKQDFRFITGLFADVALDVLKVIECVLDAIEEKGEWIMKMMNLPIKEVNDWIERNQLNEKKLILKQISF